jgi:NAD(P)H-dependent flavin oxidoreductase YrpB (nitropropane dioxygenase family)
MADDTIRTTIFSGRPMRVFKSDYIVEWETKRQRERDELLASGKRPYKNDLSNMEEKGTPLNFLETYPIIYGQACGGIFDVKPAGDVVREMVDDARAIIQANMGLLASL